MKKPFIKRLSVNQLFDIELLHFKFDLTFRLVRHCEAGLAEFHMSSVVVPASLAFHTEVVCSTTQYTLISKSLQLFR